jgi:hypothetical protein
MKTSLKLGLLTIASIVSIACSTTTTQTAPVAPVSVSADDVSVAVADAHRNDVAYVEMTVSEPKASNHDYIPTGAPLAATRGRLTRNGNVTMR